MTASVLSNRLLRSLTEVHRAEFGRSIKLNVCPQVDGHHADPAGSGGQSDMSGGGAANSGGAEGPQREDGAAQDYPLLPLPQRALHRTKVTDPEEMIFYCTRRRLSKLT